MQQNWLIWSIAISLIFPLLMILMGELVFFLDKKSNPFKEVIAIFRGWVLPTLTLFLLLQKVFFLPDTNIFLRLTETILWITLIYWGLTLINQLLFQDAQEGSWRANVPKIFLDLSRTFWVLVGAALVCSTVWEADLAGLLTALGVGSLVIGLALQDSLGNIFSGIALLFERPVSIGDWVQIGDITGYVKEITWRSVHVYTQEKHLVIIPNSEIATGNFTNYSHEGKIHGVNIDMGVSYDDPPNKVIPVLKQTILQTIGVFHDPEPQIFLISYNDFAIIYRIRFFVKDYPQRMISSHDFNVRLWYAFKRHGITIPFPTQIEYEYKSTLPTPESLEKKSVNILLTVPGWDVINEEELIKTYKESTVKTFAKNEIVILEQQPLNGLYVILEGKAEMSIIDPDTHQTIILSQLTQGDIFGEKSALISGQVSDVTIIAIEDLQILLIPINILRLNLQTFPLLATKLGEIMELRRQQITGILNQPIQSRIKLGKS